jgi:hypothetical protein
MPSSHRRYAEWTPARMLRMPSQIGPATVALFEAIMKAKPHPEQGFRTCLGIIWLVDSYGPQRIEAAKKIRAHTLCIPTGGIVAKGGPKCEASRQYSQIVRSAAPRCPGSHCRNPFTSRGSAFSIFGGRLQTPKSTK